jgi:CheY-like chemotaxis protein
MLAFARRQSLAAEAIDIGAIVRTTVELLRRTIGESIDIRLALAADLSPALADPAQVESALANLAINARDAMPRGGTLLIEAANVVLDEREAAFSEAKPGAYVMLAVSDTGTGIPADVLDHVYEPFFTTKEAGKGTGLGLSMVYGFARQSGGLVRIHSELGRGTSVRLYLPRAEDAPSPLERRPADDAVRGGSERILLVEDNAAVRETAAALLEDLGYAVRFVESGAAALLWLDRGEPVDLLLTDVILPHGMTGHELAAEAVRRRPGLKVVFATGFSDPNIHHERLRLGPTINKPARKTELARILREVLDGPGK